MTLVNRVVFSRQSGKWKTPLELFSKLDYEFHFNFDPCNPPISNEFIKIKNSLTHFWPGNRYVDENGETVYRGPCRAFLNPDYAKIDRWLAKAWLEIMQGRCELAVILVPSRTDTEWFHLAMARGATFRFLRRRLQFSGHNNNAPFPSVVIIMKKPFNT